MARNRLIYQSEQLFVGPVGPRPCNSLHSSLGVSGNIYSAVSGDNFISELFRIQNINWSYSKNLTDLNQFGEVASIDRIPLNAPSIELNYSYLLSNFINEGLIGLSVTQSGDTNQLSAVSGILRPSIAGIKIAGTKEMSEEDLKKGLKEVGLAEGRVFNKSLLDRVEQELRQQYFGRGYYAVSIQPTVTPLERNRVDINIQVAEGKVARIREINLVGNRLFPDKKLLKLFTLGPRPWYAFFSSRDKYSKQKLAGDLERLRNYYQDQGFLEFTIDSTQVAITPDKEKIHITVNITEGKKYTVTGHKLAGTFVIPESELNALIGIQPGSVFSRKEVTETTKKMSDRLANDGYAFANVHAIPEVDKEKSEVFFTFFVDPGRRIYVRRRTSVCGDCSATAGRRPRHRGRRF